MDEMICKVGGRRMYPWRAVDGEDERFMEGSDAVRLRTSARQFLPNPVPALLLREILTLAARTPSGGNLQPWRVYALAGRPLADLKRQAAESEDHPQHEVYPPALWEPYRTRRYRNGEDLYATLGIAREDRDARLGQFARNGDLFDAPVGLFFFIDRKMGRLQWADMGMLMQNIMLLALDRGLSTCAQAYWVRYPALVVAAVEAPADTLMLVCGMALGYADEDAAINRCRAGRDPLSAWAEFRGFEADSAGGE